VEDDLHVAPRLKQLAGMEAMRDFALKSGAAGVTLSGAGSALLVLTRTGRVSSLEDRLASRVRRLWGEAGRVVAAKAVTKPAAFV
jgi:homoserine kinase